MKKVIFIFLILISSLCLVVISCADKDESSTSSSSSGTTTDNTTTVSIVDGSAEGYMRIGNMQIVWGVQNTVSAVTFPVAFSETPKYVHGTGCGSNVTLSTTTFDHGCATSNYEVNYLIIGKWQ